MASPVSRRNLPTAGAPPQRLDRYEVLGRLASGGMAEILLGRVVGPHGFERAVAMKRILPHLVADRAFVDMFVNEARIAANIRHARVVQVHELAEIDGEYLLVMEYLEGENLGGLMRRLWLRREPLDRGLAAHIVAEACAGLHAAHELTDADGTHREVIHRDVSPQNVMITYAGEVKVLDFGIAKAADSSRTQAGQVKGKCEYMSPEQCRGEPLDRGSDIFSLGIVLYELTVGARLFKRPTALLAYQAVCEARIPRPTEIDPTYPPALEAICLRALARDRRDRYATMLDMRRDLVPVIRSLAGHSGRASEDELLAELMARLFADRIQEKRDMLREASTRSAIDHIPVAEIDEHVELPELPPTIHLALPELPPTIHAEIGVPRTRVSRRMGRRGAIAVAVLGAVALCAIGAWLGHRAKKADGGAAVSSRPQDDSTGSVPAPSPAPSTPASTSSLSPPASPAPSTPASTSSLSPPASPAPISPPVPTSSSSSSSSSSPSSPSSPDSPDSPTSPSSPTTPPSKVVSVVVESVPPGAQVFVAGQPRGTTPCTIELARAADPIAVAVSHPGFHRAIGRVVPTADQKLVLHMQPVAAVSKPTSKPKPPAQETPTFERFD